MIKYKYNKTRNEFTENGHTMFFEDVLRRLERLVFLEEERKNKSKCISCGENAPVVCIECAEKNASILAQETAEGAMESMDRYDR